MTSFKLQLPPRIREVVKSTEFYQDEDLQESIINSKMTRNYVIVLFICSLFLIVVVLL